MPATLLTSSTIKVDAEEAAQMQKGNILPMAWDKGRYYTRSRKVRGRVIRTYVGGGDVGYMAALADQQERVDRAQERAARRAEQAKYEALDQEVADLDDACDRLTRAALLSLGYHQHDRGEWRKRRG
jgi:hypothetical protein